MRNFYAVIFCFLNFISTANAAWFHDYIYDACSKNNEDFLLDVKTLVDILHKENAKIASENLSKKEADKKIETISRSLIEKYDDIVFQRKQAVMELMKSNKSDDRFVMGAMLDTKRNAVLRSVGELMPQREPPSDIRITRVFVENCQLVSPK